MKSFHSYSNISTLDSGEEFLLLQKVSNVKKAS